MGSWIGPPVGCAIAAAAMTKMMPEKIKNRTVLLIFHTNLMIGFELYIVSHISRYQIVITSKT